MTKNSSFKLTIRTPNKKKHLCIKCGKKEVIYDIGIKKYYCLNCEELSSLIASNGKVEER